MKTRDITIETIEAKDLIPLDLKMGSNWRLLAEVVKSRKKSDEIIEENTSLKLGSERSSTMSMICLMALR